MLPWLLLSFSLSPSSFLVVKPPPPCPGRIVSQSVSQSSLKLPPSGTQEERSSVVFVLLATVGREKEREKEEKDTSATYNTYTHSTWYLVYIYTHTPSTTTSTPTDGDGRTWRALLLSHDEGFSLGSGGGGIDSASRDLQPFISCLVIWSDWGNNQFLPHRSSKHVSKMSSSGDNFDGGNRNSSRPGSPGAGGGGNSSNGNKSDAVCSQCHAKSVGGFNNNNNNNLGGAFNNNNNNNSGGSMGGYGVPPIQVTAKVLFGSVSAISALNAERKKKS